MLFRGSLARPARLAPPSRLRPRHRPPPRPRPPPVRHGPPSAQRPPESCFPPPPAPAADDARLASVLDALRTRDTGRLIDAFFAWTSLLAKPYLPAHAAAVRHLRSLPATTVSEIVRALDPVANPRLDVAHGFAIAAGEVQFTPAAALVDDFGVRRHHGRVLVGMQALLRARPSPPLAPADYEVMMRCAGAACDPMAAKHFWSAMTRGGLMHWRSLRTWTEFLRSRFMTEPAYYQFDRTRVLVQPRDLHRDLDPMSPAAVKRLERMRLSLNAMAHQPWNRDPAQPERDWRRLLRKRKGHASFLRNFKRLIGLGYRVDEPFLCAAIVAFSRCAMQNNLGFLVLRRYYGIRIVRDQQNFCWQVDRGYKPPPGSHKRPTARLLNAIADAYGTLCNLPLGLSLIMHISRHFDLPVPHETWSNLLGWAYINASAPYRHMRRADGTRDLRPGSIQDPLDIWRIMTSDPYNVIPTFADYCYRVKMLVRLRALAAAVDAIRHHLVPHYRALQQDYRRAVLDELLLNDASARPATHRRRQAEARMDHARYQIDRCLHLLLKTASQNSAHRRGRVMHALVPDLLAEFGEFFPHYVRYRTEKGLVVIQRHGEPQRFRWERHSRTTLPAKLGSGHLDGAGPVDASQWPMAETMRVMGWRRVPALRRRVLGHAPVAANDISVTDATDVSSTKCADYALDQNGVAWFDKLEKELLL